MWLVELNCNFQCDWLTELSDNNLQENYWKMGVFFKPIIVEEIVTTFLSKQSGGKSVLAVIF